MTAVPPDEGRVLELVRFVRARRPLFVLTGAGCSTESGLPAYRDERGAWKHAPPIYFEEFRDSPATRRRYWARSLVGWPRMSNAQPNPAHHALARLERAGHVIILVTQNVDRLHQRAGSGRVVDLHGRIDRVRCLDCRALSSRREMQNRLIAGNPHHPTRLDTASRPDGDVPLDAPALEDFKIPACKRCGGILKPDVVFFGESVPRSNVERSYAALERSRGVLVAGSSLTVYSGRRFCNAAKTTGKPLALVNRGHTRLDEQAFVKYDGPCGPSLSRLADMLGA